MKNKLFKYAQVRQLDNVLEHDKCDLRREAESKLSAYQSHILKMNISDSNVKIILEIGCGKGEYTVTLAENDNSNIYIGIDIKGDRIYKGAKYAKDNHLENVLFLRMSVEQLLEVFPRHFVDEIWLTFSDPYPKKGDEKRRLTSHRYLEYYRYILKLDGIMHLKTDNTCLYEYSLNSVRSSRGNILYKSSDIYESGEALYPLNIKTFYEKKHIKLGAKIKYIKFQFH